MSTEEDVKKILREMFPDAHLVAAEVDERGRSTTCVVCESIDENADPIVHFDAIMNATKDTARVTLMEVISPATARDRIEDLEDCSGLTWELDELRELLRWAQHHVPRGVPECNAWLQRAQSVLGPEFAASRGVDLTPEAPQPNAMTIFGLAFDDGEGKMHLYRDFEIAKGMGRP